MSLIRQCLQQISRKVDLKMPKPTTIRFFNSDLIEKYQKIQEATMDYYKKQRAVNNSNISIYENTKTTEEIMLNKNKVQIFKNLVNYVAKALTGAAATFKKMSNDGKNDILPSVDVAVASKNTEQKEDHGNRESSTKTTPPIELKAAAAAADIEKLQKFKKLNENEIIVLGKNASLHNFSTPERIFHYFASICLNTQKGTTETMMTPDDFLSSIYPNKMRASKFGDVYLINENDVEKRLNLKLRDDSIFLKLGYKGLISYPDYLFLMTVLMTPIRHFEIAFQLFDFNSNGILWADEFQGLIALARQSVTFAATGHDPYRKVISHKLMRYFFGEDLKQYLTLTDFLKFQRNLKSEILSLEFDSKPANQRGLISESDFAELLIAYAGYSGKEKEKKLRQVHKHFKHNQRGLSRRDYFDFWELLNNLNDIEMALSFYHLAKAKIDKPTFHHVAKSVVKIDLSEHVIELAFTIFGGDGEDDAASGGKGLLRKNEFLNAMKTRISSVGGGSSGGGGDECHQRNSNDVDFIAMMQAFKKCAFERRSYDF